LGADPIKQGAPLASAEGALADIGKQLGATATQVALSWLLHRAPNIFPIPGTTSIAHLEHNVVAAKLNLTQDQLQQIASVAGRAIPSERNSDHAGRPLDNKKSAVSYYHVS
jgi:aryl-alcohol dehydrogenase-like predicted oxidoreductase